MRTVFGLDNSGGALLVPAPDFPLGALYLSLFFHLFDYTYGGVDDGLCGGHSADSFEGRAGVADRAVVGVWMGITAPERF